MLWRGPYAHPESHLGMACTLLHHPLTLVAPFGSLLASFRSLTPPPTSLPPPFFTQAHRRALCGGAPLLALCLWADSRVRLHRRRRLFLPAPPEGEAPVSRLHPAAHQGVSRSRDAVTQSVGEMVRKSQ